MQSKSVCTDCIADPEGGGEEKKRVTKSKRMIKSMQKINNNLQTLNTNPMNKWER